VKQWIVTAVRPGELRNDVRKGARIFRVETVLNAPLDIEPFALRGTGAPPNEAKAHGNHESDGAGRRRTSEESHEENHKKPAGLECAAT
jgi:hypothetical protein